MKIVQIGFIFGIVGSLLVGLAPSGALASTFLILGRICQGLSAACIMPASLALVKAYWEGAARQRAVSLWSMGSWGGVGLRCALRRPDGGKRRLALDLHRVRRGVGDRHADGPRHAREQGRRPSGELQFDIKGIADLHGRDGRPAGLRDAGRDAGLDEPRVAWACWRPPSSFGFLFVRVESGNPNAFVDFRLFRNPTYTGATLSNLLLNAVAGIIIVAMTLVQIGGGLSAQEAGLLTLGYAIAIVAVHPGR